MARLVNIVTLNIYHTSHITHHTSCDRTEATTEVRVWRSGPHVKRWLHWRFTFIPKWVEHLLLCSNAFSNHWDPNLTVPNTFYQLRMYQPVEEVEGVDGDQIMDDILYRNERGLVRPHAFSPASWSLARQAGGSTSCGDAKWINNFSICREEFKFYNPVACNTWGGQLVTIKDDIECIQLWDVRNFISSLTMEGPWM